MNTPSSDNVLLGAGALYIDRFVNGQKTGELHFGNVTTFSITTTDETKKLYESMSKSRGLYKEVTVRRDIVCAVTGNEFNIENVALTAMGNEGAITQTTGTVTSATLTASAQPGRFYPTGKRNISDVVVSQDATDYELGVDYAVDAKSGRIHVLPGGSITKGAALEVSFSYAAVTLKTVEGGNAGTIEASLRFIGDPTAGPAVECEVFRVKVNPNGELSFISDEFGAWSLNCSVLAEAGRPANESPYYRVIYPEAA